MVKGRYIGPSRDFHVAEKIIKRATDGFSVGLCPPCRKISRREPHGGRRAKQGAMRGERVSQEFGQHSKRAAVGEWTRHYRIPTRMCVERLATDPPVWPLREGACVKLLLGAKKLPSPLRNECQWFELRQRRHLLSFVFIAKWVGFCAATIGIVEMNTLDLHF